jgi:hypothetical protein
MQTTGSHTVSHVVLKGRCEITSIPTLLIAGNLLLYGGVWRRHVEEGSASPPFPNKLWSAFALILELIFIYFSMYPRQIVPLYFQTA